MRFWNHSQDADGLHSTELGSLDGLNKASIVNPGTNEVIFSFVPTCPIKSLLSLWLLLLESHPLHCTYASFKLGQWIVQGQSSTLMQYRRTLEVIYLNVNTYFLGRAHY